MKNTKKTEKGDLEPYRPTTWFSPVGHMEEVFEEFFRRPFGFIRWPSMPRLRKGIEPSPSVDIIEKGDNIVVKSELPGMSKEDIEVNVTDNVITISGEKKMEEKVGKKDYYRLERLFGSFKRSFALPLEVQSDKAKASFKDGVLEVKISKTEEAKKKEKKIKIE